MNKKILSWLESLMEEEALGLAPNPYQEAMKKNIAEQATAQAVQEATQPTEPVVPGKIIFTDNFYDRDAVSKDLDNFYLFGDNTDDRLNTHYIPTQTQAVIRGLPNAIGIDTKHNRGWDITSFLSDADFDSMQEHYNNQFKLIEDKLKEGHNVIIPRAGIGTGKAQLPDKAPRIFEDINNRISNLYNVYNKGKAPTDLGSQQMANTAQQFYEVSSAGDKRFSALYATFKPGTNIFGQDVSNRTIESVYQHGVKQGDWITNNNYKTGRPMSKAIITGNTEDDSYAQGYLPLWQEWAKQNPDLIEDLRTKSKGMQLNDKFARTRVSQARALTDILNTVPSNEQLLSNLAKPKDLGEAQFKVISGGQTGIDILGVKLAKEYGLPTGGTIGMYPNGKYVIEADDAIDRSQFGFTTTDNTYYPYRTSQNVQNSDGTIYFKTDDDSRGYQATRREAMKYNKPFLENPASVDDAYKFITDNNIKTLNIAGNRGSKLPSELRLSTEELLRALFSKFKDNDLSVELEKYNNSIQNEYDIRRKALDDLLNFALSNKALTPVHKERMLKRIPMISNNLNKLTPEKISFSDMQKTYNDLDKNVYQKYTDEQINNYINRLDRATDLDVSDMLESANNYNELSEEDLDYYLNLLKTISRNRRF